VSAPPQARPTAESGAGEAGGDQEYAGELWLVRHGETEWSRTRRHTGVTDVPLTPRGEEQAAALGPMLLPLAPVLVLVSPRLRSRRTAELAGLVVSDVDDDLSEWDYGEYEGLTTAQIRVARPGWTIWNGDPPGGETAVQVGARAERALGRIQAALARGNVIVVTHGHFGRVLAARWLGLDPTGGRLFALEPAAPCVLGTEHARPVVRHWNLATPAR
jgi:broad specificity phosphatase PhoE